MLFTVLLSYQSAAGLCYSPPGRDLWMRPIGNVPPPALLESSFLELIVVTAQSLIQIVPACTSWATQAKVLLFTFHAGSGRYPKRRSVAEFTANAAQCSSTLIDEAIVRAVVGERGGIFLHLPTAAAGLLPAPIVPLHDSSESANDLDAPRSRITCAADSCLAGILNDL